MQIQNQISKIKATIQKSKIRIKFWILIFSFAFCVLRFALPCYAREMKGGPIIVNGDIVEYLTDSKEVTAEGNVSVIYKGAKLTCDKLIVNTQTKDATAEGNVKLEDAESGTIEGPKITYNFETKIGTIMDANFKANPYFGKAKTIEKVSDKEFIARGGYASTCNYDRPHYRIQSKEVRMFPGDKIQTKHNTFYFGNIPFFYLPFYNHSLKDPMMHVRVSPGQRKEWGGYVLTAWRYNLTRYVDGRVYLDYRQKLGFAEGFGANYNTRRFGRGDLKVYYTEEKPENLSIGEPQAFNRYLVRLRHKWDINKRTYLISEYYKIHDAKRKFAPVTDSFLKEYFYREYEEDTQPLSYVLLQHYFNYSSLGLLMQKRTNHWFDYIEKKPEVIFSMPNYRIGSTPLYFQNESTLADFNRKGDAVGNDTTLFRVDTTNRISLPVKVAFIRVTPFAAERGTFYDKANEGSSNLMRAVFYSGAEASTKLYKTIDLKTNFLGLDIDGLRHVVTPLMQYQYNHKPTINRSRLKQIDYVDALASNSSVYMELSNKLQVKRKNRSVDLVDLLVRTEYLFNSIDGERNIKRTDEFSDILLRLKLLPYAWLRVDLDATYKNTPKRRGRDSDPNDKHFSDVNYNISFDFGKGHSFGIGQRYHRLDSNEVTAQLNWRINPKWRFSIYGRYNAASATDISHGMREQEYTLSRDFHCWMMDLTYNITQEKGHTVFLVFRLKAFPETEFGFDQSYREPKSGSQTQ